MKTCQHTDSYTRASVITHVECGNVAVVVFALPDHDDINLCGAHWAEASAAWAEAVEAWAEVKK